MRHFSTGDDVDVCDDGTGLEAQREEDPGVGESKVNGGSSVDERQLKVLVETCNHTKIWRITRYRRVVV